MTAAKAERPPTFDHLAGKRPLVQTVQVVLDDAPVEALRAAQAAGDEVAEARARTALAAATVVCTFRSIGRKRYARLVAAHPPTDEDHADAKAQGGTSAPWHGDTFAPALVAACCVSPEMTVAQAEQLAEDWNEAEFMSLFIAALAVNTTRREVEWGKDSARTAG